MNEQLRTYRIGPNQENKVLVDWGAPIRYSVFSPDEALALARLLYKHANDCKAKEGT